MLIATAGHVDHGKTSLVERLTGVCTDRLAEEKRRGLSIELGYAFREGPGDEPMGFIDVPGHHRFLNTMIAGISGIDLGLLVVAADDGLMPQSLEHLEVLRLLGVEQIAGVVSKVDLVEPARRDAVLEQLSGLLPGAPLCSLSNQTGEGLEQLLSLLERQAPDHEKQQLTSPFRMCIDRAFTQRGAGLIVTGTGLSGAVHVGDTLFLHSLAGGEPRETEVRVREVHAQGRAAPSGRSGQRCALNLAGKLSLDRVHRGDVLCALPHAAPARRIDARCWPVADRANALRHLGRVKLYLGTRRIPARTYFLDRGEQDQRVQLILDQPVVAFAGDRFVLRDDAERANLAGGMVIDPASPRRGKTRAERLRHLDALESNSPDEALQRLLFENRELVSPARMGRIWNLSPQSIDALPDQHTAGREAIARVASGGTQWLVCAALRDECTQRILAAVRDGAETTAGHPVMTTADLLIRLGPDLPAELVQAVLEEQIRAGKLIRRDQGIGSPDKRPGLSPGLTRAWQMLEQLIQKRGLEVPLKSELQRETGLDAERLESLLQPLVRAGYLLQVGDRRVALPATLQELAARIQCHLEDAPGISVIEAKALFGLGRNVTIEVLEFLDQIGYTRRQGDLRVVANPEAARRRLGV